MKLKIGSLSGRFSKNQVYDASGLACVQSGNLHHSKRFRSLLLQGAALWVLFVLCACFANSQCYQFASGNAASLDFHFTQVPPLSIEPSVDGGNIYTYETPATVNLTIGGRSITATQAGFIIKITSIPPDVRAGTSGSTTLEIRASQFSATQNVNFNSHIILTGNSQFFSSSALATGPPQILPSANQWVTSPSSFAGLATPLPSINTPLNITSISNTCPTPPTCPINVLPVPVKLPGDTQPTVMTATFGAAPRQLQDFASDCGFYSFNWEQLITHISEKAQFASEVPALNPDNVVNSFACFVDVRFCFMFAPPYFNDPPNGGYTYAPDFNPYPYVRYSYPDPIDYDPVYALYGWYTPGYQCTYSGNGVPHYCQPGIPYQVSTDGTTLGFADHVKSISLPSGDDIEFITYLVGIKLDKSSQMLSCWSWKSTYNGQSGGVTLTAIGGSVLPPALSPSQAQVTASGLAYSRVSRTFNGTVTITNVDQAPIAGTLQLMLLGLSSGASLVNATANLAGTPYITQPNVSLAPGQSISVPVEFSSPITSSITFTPAAYLGGFVSGGCS